MVAFILALVLLVGAPGQPGAPGPKPSGPRLTITDMSPFTVRGTGFKPKEQVTLVVSAKNRLRRLVVADARGTFVRQVVLVQVEGACPAWFVRAVGSRGSVAVLKRVPECANLQPVDR